MKLHKIMFNKGYTYFESLSVVLPYNYFNINKHNDYDNCIIIIILHGCNVPLLTDKAIRDTFSWNVWSFLIINFVEINGLKPNENSRYYKTGTTTTSCDPGPKIKWIIILEFYCVKKVYFRSYRSTIRASTSRLQLYLDFNYIFNQE